MFRAFKRFCDFLSSFCLFLFISPFFLVLMIIVAFNMGFPLFFTQVRTTKNQKPFKLIKFRTMKNIRDKSGNLLPDEQRMTKFGNWLRSSSLDELPELLNIIAGHMAVIGPRPLPVSYNDYFKEKELDRFKVRGGLITPDSLDESPVISWDKQFEYEVDYANNLSLKKDIKLFFGVFKMLFRRKKANYGEYVRKPLDEERGKKHDN